MIEVCRLDDCILHKRCPGVLVIRIYSRRDLFRRGWFAKYMMLFGIHCSILLVSFCSELIGAEIHRKFTSTYGGIPRHIPKLKIIMLFAFSHGEHTVFSKLLKFDFYEIGFL